MSKYYAVILLATCGLGAIPSPHFGRYIRSASPWISAAVAAVICAPHLVWLLTHDAPPLRYFEQVSGKAFNAIAADATSTALASLGSLLPALAVVSWFAFRTTPLPVIASEAKQPSLDASQPAEEGPALAVKPALQDDPPRGGAGLLRCARNDGRRELAIFAPRAAPLPVIASAAKRPSLDAGQPAGERPALAVEPSLQSDLPRGGAGLLRFARNDGGENSPSSRSRRSP